jgi:GNAT superfamily N-acetyltransferase
MGPGRLSGPVPTKQAPPRGVTNQALDSAGISREKPLRLRQNTLHANAYLRIGTVGRPQFDLLTRMYDLFDPIGAAFGLPPHSAGARRQWIWDALGHRVNVAMLSPAGNVVGHCFLAADTPGVAELAIFVHQNYRRRGIGTALVKAALEQGANAGLRRVWSMTASADRVALRLQRKCGFRVAESNYVEAELEIELPGSNRTRPHF